MGGVGSGGHNIKPPEQRTRGNRQKRDTPRVVDMRKCPPPELPRDLVENWPNQTRKWWNMWCRSPLCVDNTEEDWAELLDTALIHALVWSPALYGTPSWFKATAQLRQRTANYGVTPLDRQRLRIQFVFAEKGEDESGISYGAGQRRSSGDRETKGSARTRRGPLREAG